jgi:hypothetical protein
VSTLRNELSWEYHHSRLLLRVGDRHLLVPGLVTALLFGDAGHGLSDDPSIDLLRLERDLRHYGRFVDEEICETTQRVTHGCKFLMLAYAEGGRKGRRDRRLAREYLAAAAALHAAQTAEQHRIRSWKSQVRQFVIDAGVSGGFLAEAAAGWCRRSDRPEFVPVFATVRDFIEANPDRADPEWWAYRSHMPGTPWGGLWRRDGDDDDPGTAPLPRSGPWRLAYLPQTGEIYACRPAGRKPEEVWLLSTGQHDSAHVTGLLTELRRHIREPNSLILAASVLHETRSGPLSSDAARTPNPRQSRRDRSAVADPATTADDGTRRVMATGTRAGYDMATRDIRGLDAQLMMAMTLATATILWCAGCGSTSATVSATPSAEHSRTTVVPSVVSPAGVAGRRAIASYVAMWQAFVSAAATSDWQSPTLGHYATGVALSTLSRGLYADHYNGLVSKGRPTHDVTVTSAAPASDPAEVVVVDCSDSTDAVKYHLDDDRPAHDGPGGRQQINATVQKQSDGSWKVTDFGVQAVGTC